MKIDIERGLANKIYRALSAFMPQKHVRHTPLTLQELACKYGRGNVKFQMGLVMSDTEYEKQKERVLAYDFI